VRRAARGPRPARKPNVSGSFCVERSGKFRESFLSPSSRARGATRRRSERPRDTTAIRARRRRSTISLGRPRAERSASRAGLNVDAERWVDAAVEFARGVDFYASAPAALALEDDVRRLSCLAGLSAAYAEWGLRAPGADAIVDGATGGAVVVAAGADVRGLAIDAAVRAERDTNALLEVLARGAPVDGARKRDLCALAVEVAHAKKKAADLRVGGLGPASR